MVINEDLKIKAITNKEYIERLFKKVAKIKTNNVVVSTDSGEVPEVLEHKGKQFYLTNECYKNMDVKITLMYNDYVFYFFSAIDGNLTVNIPETLYLLTKRELERHQIDDIENAFVIYNDQKYKIVNLHTKGLALESDSNTIKENILKDMIISLNKRTFFADAEIRYIENHEKCIYGLRFIDINWINKMEIIQFIIKRYYMNLHNMTEFTKEEIFDLFELSGYLDLGDKGLESNFDDMIETLKKIDNTPQLSKSFIYVNNERKILSGANIVKLYDYTFLAQHLAVKKEAQMNIPCKFDLYKAILNYLLNHEYFKYYLAYFERDLEWHQGLYKKIVEYVNDPNKLTFDILYWFAASVSSFEKHKSNYEIEKLYEYGRFLDYTKNNMCEIERGCYCYNEDINLEKAKILYELKDLYIERKIYTVSLNGTLVAYLVAEVFSPGINLFNCVDNVKVYFTSKDLDINAFMSAVYMQMNILYGHYNKKYFYIIANATNDIDFTVINVAHLKRILDVGRVMANTNGALEYKNYFKTIMR